MWHLVSQARMTLGKMLGTEEKASSQSSANLLLLQDVWLCISRVYGFRCNLRKLAALLVGATTDTVYPRRNTVIRYRAVTQSKHRAKSSLPSTYVFVAAQLHFTSPEMDPTQNPLIFPIMRKRPWCIFFCNESVNRLGWLTSFSRQKISYRSPVELYSGLIAPCQFLTFP